MPCKYPVYEGSTPWASTRLQAVAKDWAAIPYPTTQGRQTSLGRTRWRWQGYPRKAKVVRSSRERRALKLRVGLHPMASWQSG